MHKLTIYDLIILQEYFAKKANPTDEDRARADKLDNALGRAADGLVSIPTKDLSVKEIFEKLTGEQLS